MNARVRSGCNALQQSLIVVASLTSLVAGAEAKIVMTDPSPGTASAFEQPFQPDPPLRIQPGATPNIGYYLYGPTLNPATPSYGPPPATNYARRTAAFTRSIRNDAIRLRLLQNATQHCWH
jgi:hypothetical protein